MKSRNDEFRLGLNATDEILAGNEENALAVFDRLRRDKLLAASMHEMNMLLHHPAHGERALAAIRRIGMEHAG
jgi:hypothetical protein